MFDLVAAVNDEKVFQANLARSPILQRADVALHVQRGCPSAAIAYNQGLRSATREFVVFVHQDVYLPAGWAENALEGIRQLSASDPDWAVLGLYGVTKTGAHVGHVWSSGLNRTLGSRFAAPAAVDTVDELLLIVRRSSGIEFDEGLPGFHLYGTDIAQTAWDAKLSAYVVCAPVVHNSRPILYLDRGYVAAHDYLRRKWRHRLPIQNCIAPLIDSAPKNLYRKLRWWLAGRRFAGFDRKSLDRNLDPIEVAQRVGFQ